MVAAPIGSLNVAVTLALIPVPVAPEAGEVDETVGGVVSPPPPPEPVSKTTSTQ